MSTKSDILVGLYKEAKSKRIVLTKEEFAKALDYSRSQMHRLMTGLDDISEETIQRARSILAFVPCTRW